MNPTSSSSLKLNAAVTLFVSGLMFLAAGYLFGSAGSSPNMSPTASILFGIIGLCVAILFGNVDLFQAYTAGAGEEREKARELRRQQDDEVYSPDN
jgi:hypothetical protein